jgi:ribosomal protein S18 acetylase RimI-like enzyme
LELRPYQSADRAACLEIFYANVPGGYFAPEERVDYEEFLDHPPGPYLVLEHEGAVWGAGGWVVEEGGIVSLCWGLIAPRGQKKGLGRLLAMYRLREIAKLPGVRLVRLDTSPRTAGFFEKLGFHVVAVKKDGYAPGLDRVEMLKRLEVCSA